MASSIPDYLRAQLTSELLYIQSIEEEGDDAKQQQRKNTRNFEPKPMIKTTRKGKVLVRYKKHYPILGIVNEPPTSCALGVPPVLLPKLSFPRGRNQHRNLLQHIDFVSHSRNYFFDLCVAENNNNSDNIIIEETKLFNLQKDINSTNPISPEDQYDFFNSEIRKDQETGKLTAFGEIPRSEGKCGIHPMRLQHLWMELFRRGFTFERPGPQGIDGPWIRYDLEFLRFFLFLFDFLFC